MDEEFTDVEAQMDFEDASSLTGWKLVFFFITEGRVTCDTKTGIWKVYKNVE